MQCLTPWCSADGRRCGFVSATTRRSSCQELQKDRVSSEVVEFCKFGRRRQSYRDPSPTPPPNPSPLSSPLPHPSLTRPSPVTSSPLASSPFHCGGTRQGQLNFLFKPIMRARVVGHVQLWFVQEFCVPVTHHDAPWRGSDCPACKKPSPEDATMASGSSAQRFQSHALSCRGDQTDDHSTSV